MLWPSLKHSEANENQIKRTWNFSLKVEHRKFVATAFEAPIKNLFFVNTTAEMWAELYLCQFGLFSLFITYHPVAKSFTFAETSTVSIYIFIRHSYKHAKPRHIYWYGFSLVCMNSYHHAKSLVKQIFLSITCIYCWTWCCCVFFGMIIFGLTFGYWSGLWSLVWHNYCVWMLLVVPCNSC
jgi:hypothetical protein